MTTSDNVESNMIRTVAILCLVMGFLAGMLVGYFTLTTEKTNTELPTEYIVEYSESNH